ncbi:MAG: 3-deoxy-7-phosphoheptulonate synthase [Eubacteriales bacterium]
MLIVIKPGTPEDQIKNLEGSLKAMGFGIDRSQGEDYVVLGLVGDVRSLNENIIGMNPIVNDVIHVTAPYKRANIQFHPERTIVKVGDHTIGGDELAIMAGPCSVESEEQIVSIAKQVKAAGAQYLRGGAYKPRSSPYSFQGLGEIGLDYLNTARQETGLLVVSELLHIEMIPKFLETVDIIQVGARNMQNFTMLKELGKVNKPILLKRGIAATMEEWLMSAEYIIAEGNTDVILCERGIRTFETYTRNTLDIAAVPVIKNRSHLPIVVDPSHAGGEWWMVSPLAKAAVSAGADGLVIEVHAQPEKAFSDGQQSLKPKKFAKLMEDIEVLAKLEGKSIHGK